MPIIKTLIDNVNNKDEIINSLNKLHPHISEPFKECANLVFDQTKIYHESYNTKIDYVLKYLHDHLNTGNWCDVPEHKRQAFTSASFVKAGIVLKSSEDEESRREAVKCIDKGFLLGLPLKENINLLTDCARELSSSLGSCSDKVSDAMSDESPRKKIKLDDEYTNLKGIEVDSGNLVPLEEFYKSYFLPEKPIVIRGCMSHWPACKKWPDIDYLLQTAGERTVPIEIGSSYSDTNFSQKLMTLREFIKTYYYDNSKDLGYLAQHDLLNQVPDLKSDIRIPEYCCTSRNFDDDNLFEPEINAWFGPKGTLSSLHHDPKDNLLCQIFGIKQVLLFAPSDSDYLYAHELTLLSNTAQVDPVSPDLEKYPEFKNATMFKCLLNPGEMLYIPPKWWHHVTALERSFSVNFWWQ